MFEQTFKNIDDILHKDAGCTSELDYTEQSSWLLFLKYLDALEADKAAEAELEGKPYLIARSRTRFPNSFSLSSKKPNASPKSTNANSPRWKP